MTIYTPKLVHSLNEVLIPHLDTSLIAILMVRHHGLSRGVCRALLLMLASWLGGCDAAGTVCSRKPTICDGTYIGTTLCAPSPAVCHQRTVVGRRGTAGRRMQRGREDGGDERIGAGHATSLDLAPWTPLYPSSQLYAPLAGTLTTTT